MRKIVRTLLVAMLLSMVSTFHVYAQDPGQCACQTPKGQLGILYTDSSGAYRCGAGCRIITRSEGVLLNGSYRPISEMSKWSLDEVFWDQ